MQIGQKMLHLASVDSTNNYAANLVKEGLLSHGTVILADEQFAGKGQRGAEWLSKPSENLTFSVFLDGVNLSVDHQFHLSRLVALCVVDFLKKFGLQSEIKWPNDIYVNETKIAGILIENQLRGNVVQKSIVGIGINVNQTEFGNINATSIKALTGTGSSLQELMFSFIHAMNVRFEQWNSLEKTKKEYHGILYKRGVMAQFRDQHGIFQGIVHGTNDRGNLLMTKSTGEEMIYEIKEIEWL